MFSKIIRTKAGNNFVEFMRSERGKAIDKFLVRYSGFSLLMAIFSAKVGFPPIPVLLMFTQGRKSGQERSTVMPYLTLNGRIYLIGSNGAKPKDPAWVENLRGDPRARIIISRKIKMVKARLLEIESDERTAVWAYAKTQTPQYETYQKATTRQIPIVALE